MSIKGITGTSLKSLEKEYETISNNLANANTAGFKRTINIFSRKLNEQSQGSGNDNAGSASIKANSSIDYSQGNIARTDRNLDLAIAGPGFFVLETVNGRKYSRSGSMNISPTGHMVNSEGELVAGENGPIVIPSDVSYSQINVAADGSVTADGRNVGKILIADMSDKFKEMQPIGNGCYVVGDDINVKMLENPVVKQGFQEASNVNVVEELVGLINVTRLYEANMKVLSKQSDDSKNLLSLAMG